jgi:PAS domain S-box-containing protein
LRSIARNQGCDGAFQYVSPRFTQLTGLRRDDLPVSFDALLDRVHPDDREAVREADEYAARNGEPAHLEYRMLGGNGEWIWVDNRSVLMRDEQGHPVTWHGALLDISEQKRLEASLRESQERSAARSRMPQSEWRSARPTAPFSMLMLPTAVSSGFHGRR